MLPSTPSLPISTPSSRIRLSNALGLSRRAGAMGLAVAHQLDAQCEARAAHVADQRVLRHQALDAVLQVGADRTAHCR